MCIDARGDRYSKSVERVSTKTFKAAATGLSDSEAASYPFFNADPAVIAVTTALPLAPLSKFACRTLSIDGIDIYSAHREQALTTPDILSDGDCQVRKKWYRTSEPIPFGSTSARCHGFSGFGAITVYRSPEVCKIPPRLPPTRSVACHPSLMHSATALAECFDSISSNGGFFLMSPTLEHPASRITASPATTLRMSFPLWFGGTVAPGRRKQKAQREAGLKATNLQETKRLELLYRVQALDQPPLPSPSSNTHLPQFYVSKNSR